MAAFWIILGCIFLWRQAFLLKRIRKKGAKLIFRYIIALCAFASVSILTTAWGIPGTLSKIIGLLIPIALWIYAFRQNRKLKGHFAELCEQKLNSTLLKRIALVHILVGVGILAATALSNYFEAQQKGAQSTQKLTYEHEVSQRLEVE